MVEFNGPIELDVKTGPVSEHVTILPPKSGTEARKSFDALMRILMEGYGK